MTALTARAAAFGRVVVRRSCAAPSPCSRETRALLSLVSLPARSRPEIKSGDLALCQTVPMGKRQESRQRIEAQIVELGRRQLASEGAAGLSVRAIARDLGMVSSAVLPLRRRPRRAAHDAAGGHLLRTGRRRRAGPRRGRRRLAGRRRRDRRRPCGAGRSTEPACWALLYGSPVPGYHAPAEITTAPGTRVVGALFDAVATGVVTGDIVLTEHHVAQPISKDCEAPRTSSASPATTRW